jgi:hypothetical protein
MNLTHKLINDILLEVERLNKNLNPLAIPHSDVFIKQMLSTLGISAETARFALRMLAEAHKIFVMEIVAEDPQHNIDRVEGYIAADLVIVTNLKNFFQDMLCQIYEKQFHKRLLIHQVIKEIFPIIKSFNNTELGQIANKTIMLMEFERLAEKNATEYTDEYKENLLSKLAAKENIAYQPKSGTKTTTFGKPTIIDISREPHGSFVRAVDTPEYQEFSEKRTKYPIQRILNIYGIDFFVKVSFRNYQFSQLRQIVEDRQITKKEDLTLIKTVLDKVKSNMYHDRELERYRDDIYSLERSVTHAIYFSFNPKKN